MRPVSRNDIVKGRDIAAPLTNELITNLGQLLIAINKLQECWPAQFIVTSGYRPQVLNSLIAGASKRSSHMSCQAADIADPGQLLSKWLTANPQYLVDCGLYMEYPEPYIDSIGKQQPGTLTWCHLQIRPTKNRIFKPY